MCIRDSFIIGAVLGGTLRSITLDHGVVLQVPPLRSRRIETISDNWHAMPGPQAILCIADIALLHGALIRNPHLPFRGPARWSEICMIFRHAFPPRRRVRLGPHNAAQLAPIVHQVAQGIQAGEGLPLPDPLPDPADPVLPPAGLAFDPPEFNLPNFAQQQLNNWAAAGAGDWP